MRTFGEVDQELYDHERSYYRYCASGGGSDPSRSKAWIARRAELTAEWHQLCPYREWASAPPVTSRRVFLPWVNFWWYSSTYDSFNRRRTTRFLCFEVVTQYPIKRVRS